MSKKIIAIGNAILDILAKTEDDFLQNNSFTKGSMSLISEDDLKKFETLKIEKISSGGSAGNTIAALAQLGIKSELIGKVANDQSGQQFISEINKTGCKFLSSEFSTAKSAKSFILVSSDAQRTMCTFLGCASQIEENDIKEEFFQDCEFLYLEGYLWDSPQTIKSLQKAISLAKKNQVKIAFSLSDSFCVTRHKSDFINLIQNDLDLVFCNKLEALELDKNYSNIFSQNQNLIAVVTDSQNGCEVFFTENNQQKILSFAAEKIDNLIDTTGAGDAFAAGFLFGLITNNNLEKSAKFANILASKIIQKFGGRFQQDEVNLLKNIL